MFYEHNMHKESHDFHGSFYEEVHGQVLQSVARAGS